VAFEGYLLSINNVVIPNKYIDVKAYNITPNKRRIIRDYYDGLGKHHIVYSSHTSTEIDFSTNGLMKAGMRQFLGYFPASENLTVKYYNDKTDTYQTGIFRLDDDIKFSKYKIRGADIIYKAVNIVLKED
jgi:hypothetical protein